MFKRNKNNKIDNEKKESVFNSKEFQSNQPNQSSSSNLETNSTVNNFSNEQTRPTSPGNDLFFEKFEKSKKDFIKEKKKEKNVAKKSLSSKNKLLGFESRLRDEHYFKRFWIILLSVTFFVLAYACTVIGLCGPHFASVESSSKWIAAYNLYNGVFKTSVIFSGIIICIIPLPYIFLLSSWFIGINNVHRSKSFVVSNIAILVTSIVLLFFVIILSSIVFATTVSYRPIA
ncbi:hypothetical protein D8X55_00030 [Malacoplasma penetrans]|uniref:Uncharacterized protein n=1 Tax=Malacoplasma penetrans (strain HF-2) TaxID=272633 RepID=Q8EWT8_MALP2|nr:hypothetical protein [Malacoplasma penetrans]RXY97312.1 hypothetical protein D8X55_00030 [Malacoplasma penetrans]BAC43905.1 conserved hypothetical protein [Malacoplasma penetrans HF-2]